jgi:hypothetical protein
VTRYLATLWLCALSQPYSHCLVCDNKFRGSASTYFGRFSGAEYSIKMNESDDEPFITRIAYDSTFTPGVESWTSSSSATLIGDDRMPNSELNEKVSDHRPRLNEKDSSTSSDSEPSTSTFVALRPLYTSARQSVSEHGPQSVSDMKLVQRSRKGHRKSRQGCFNCKRRKIKVSFTTKSWTSADPV